MISKVPNYIMETNFLINKVKNRNKLFFTSCLYCTSMDEVSPKHGRSLLNYINFKSCMSLEKEFCYDPPGGST
jgi:hypothetical protein